MALLSGKVLFSGGYPMTPTFRIDVKFSDDTGGKNEEGVDLGGRRREFLRVLMETIAASSTFEGRRVFY